MAKFLSVLGTSGKLVLTDLHPPPKRIPRPDNIHFISGSLPLNDVLSHPSFRILISVCDNTVVHQALYHGVMLLCFPMMGEHHHTAHRIMDKQLGLVADIRSFSELELKHAISTLLRGGNAIRQNVLTLCSFLQKRKTPPCVEVAREIDNVLKLGKEYKVVGASRPLWTLFIVEWLLIAAFLVAIVKLFFFCRTMCQDDDTVVVEVTKKND